MASVDMEKLNSFLGRFVGDLGAAVHAGMVVIGEKLGLYQALAAEPMTSAELAAKTSTDERYVRKWLCSQAAGGYVTYNEKTDKFGLTEEQAFTLANEDSPAHLPGAFQLALGSLAAVPRIAEVPHRGRNGLARTRRRRIPRLRKILSARLRRESGEYMGSRAARRERKAGIRSTGRRRRLRQGRVHFAAGQSLSEIKILRF
jgi:hypothetical protein